MRPGAAQHNPTMHLFRWHISLIKLVSLSLGKKGRSLGYEAAATYQSRQQEGKKTKNVDAEEQARWNTVCVCACVCVLCLNYHCLQQWKKLFVSHRKTLSRLLSAFFFSFQFFLFVPPLVAAAALSSNGGRASVCLCSSGPSDDLKGLLQLHDQLPIRFLHLVSEPVLQSVDGRPCDLKQKQRGC